MGARLLVTVLANQGGAEADTTRPTCVITCDATSPSAAATFNYTITFSESVTGFEVGDFGITGGSKGALGGSGAVYTCAVTPTGNAPVVATVAENVAEDGAGNLNEAATPLSIGVQTTLTYQPDDAAGMDTFANSASADGVNGSSATMSISTGTPRIGLIKFPISLGASPTVVSGVLSIWNSIQSATAKTITVSRILAANAGWDEGSTWNYKTPSSVRWAGDAASDGGADAGCSVSGTDYSGTPLGTFNYASDAPAGTKHDTNLNATELALMCAANNGMALTSSSSAQFVAHTCEGATAELRPKLVLVVNYLP